MRTRRSRAFFQNFGFSSLAETQTTAYKIAMTEPDQTLDSHDERRSLWDLRGISTHWSEVSDANAFVLRYVKAIEHYLSHLLRNEDDVEDVLQQFLVKVLDHGFSRATPDRGRFRYYLIRAVRNEVITWQRTSSRRATIPIEKLPEPTSEPTTDNEWDREWQQCLLDRCWMYLRQHEIENAGNLCHTVLRLATEQTESSSHDLAEQASSRSGQQLTPAAYRKQLSRARRLFAEHLVREVAETLDQSTPAAVREELAELGLMHYVRSFMKTPPSE